MNDGKELFQILEVRKTSNSYPGISTTLVTKQKDKFPDEVKRRLPSLGARLKEDFIPISNNSGVNVNNLAKLPSIRYLLQARKMSQIVAKSWLPKEIDEKNWLIRQLFLTGGLEPDNYDTDIPSKQIASDHSDNSADLLALYHLATEMRGTKNPLDKKKLADELIMQPSSIILPDGLNWTHIRLSLLFAGQVYLVEDSKYTLISEPILSTYEICIEYAFTLVDWNSFASRRDEFVQPGRNQKPPYFKVTIPYPTRPPLDEFTQLRQEDIYKWAMATDEGGDWPFYPDNDGGTYKSDVVKNIVPPFPYMPATCT